MSTTHDLTANYIADAKAQILGGGAVPEASGLPSFANLSAAVNDVTKVGLLNLGTMGQVATERLSNLGDVLSAAPIVYGGGADLLKMHPWPCHPRDLLAPANPRAPGPRSTLLRCPLSLRRGETW